MTRTARVSAAVLYCSRRGLYSEAQLHSSSFDADDARRDEKCPAFLLWYVNARRQAGGKSVDGQESISGRANAEVFS